MIYAVDTNVAIVANGEADPSNGGQPPSLACREAAIDFLMGLMEQGHVVVDSWGAVLEEYMRHLDAGKKPGVGHLFLLTIIRKRSLFARFVDLPKLADGSYADFPDAPRLAKFDPSDRKFAALARRENVPVANATDTDWLKHEGPLADNGIRVQFLCGTDPTTWFTQ